MTQESSTALLEPAARPRALERAAPIVGTPKDAEAEQAGDGALWTAIKLGVLALIATPSIGAIAISLSWGPGTVLACIPDALCAIAISWFWLGGFYFSAEE